MNNYNTGVTYAKTAKYSYNEDNEEAHQHVGRFNSKFTKTFKKIQLTHVILGITHCQKTQQNLKNSILYFHPNKPECRDMGGVVVW